MRLLNRFFFAMLAVLTAIAQVSTSRLEGTVQDSSGGVVPNARVEAVNVKTQARAAMQSDPEGRFLFPALPPGEYSLSVEAAGFRKAVRANLLLNVADTVTEIVSLEVGQVADTVVVEASTVRVQTADAQVGRTVVLQEIAMLPQLGRGPISLAVLSPGIQIDPSDSTFSHVNGTRQGSNNATLDGIEINDPVAPRLGLAMTANTSDTVAEFRIVTSGGKAEYGRNGGGQVEMITRSGTNEFHGGAWDYLRNTQLNANNFFNNQSGTARPNYIRNIFGGSFGGPMRKNKTFFFGSYEGGRTHQQVVRNRNVLTPEFKSGIFRWRLTAGAPIQSFNIPQNDPRGKGIDPMVKTLLARLPDPNNNDVGDILNTAGYRFNAPSNSYNDQFTIRVDHELRANHRIFYRHSWFRSSSIDTTNSAEARYPGDPDGTQGGHRAGWVVGSDWTISPTLLNEIRVGGQKTNSDFLRPRLHEAMLVPNLYTSPIADPTDFAQGRSLPFYDITDNVLKNRGKHALKAGANVRITQQYSWREDFAWPVINLSRSTFSNTPPASAGPNGATVINSTDRTRFENLYNDLLARVSDVQQRYYSDLNTYYSGGTGRNRNFVYREFGLFVQDDWKLSRRFTINLGLRYDFMGVPYERDGLQGSLDKVAQMTQASRVTDFAVVKGGNYYNNDWNNFAPRLGFAWDLTGDGRTSLRGGTGIYYDRLINATLTPADALPGFQTDARPTPNANGGDVRASDGLPNLAPPSSILLTPATDRTTSVTQMNPNLRSGYVAQFNFGIQREIVRNTVVSVEYVGTHGVKLFMTNNYNQSRIYEDFLGAFNQLKAYRDNKTPVPAANTLVRIFGSADAAVTAVGASNLDNNAVGTAANSLDQSSGTFNRYGAAGLPQTYLRNFPQFSTAYMGTNDGRSYYNSLQVGFRKRAGSLKFDANYTYSKAVDNWANEGNGTSATSAIDWFNLRLNRGLSDFDKRHSFNASFIYTLPVGRNHRFLGSSPRWVDTLLGGWNLGVLDFWQSGSRFSVSSGRGTGPGTAAAWANFSGDRGMGALDKRGDGVFLFTDAQKALFTYPEAGSIGTSGRNAFRGPRYFDMDTALSKGFRITESKVVIFRAEAYNLFNNVNFGTPGVTMATPTALGKFSSIIGNPRIVQGALRFEF